MQLGETIATYDVALALRGESGKFDVTSPTGETYHVTCAPNHSITSMEWSRGGANPQPFLIRKIAEPVAVGPAAATSEPAEDVARTPTAKSPFLIDSLESLKSGGQDLSGVLAGNPDSLQEPGRVAELDLVFLERDPEERDSEIKQPAACVCLKNYSDEGAEIPITASCANFNELDVEIRRLHAQLDDIRYRARKKFYQAQSVAASA